MRLAHQIGLGSAVLGVLAGGALMGSMTPANAQVRSIFRPAVPSSSTVRTVGVVDPAEPIDIMVTNSLSVPLGIGFSGGANLEVAPGDSAKVSFTTVPINLFLYPLASDVSTRSMVTVEDNTISTEIVEINSVAPGDASLNVDGGGTVYIY